MSDPADKSDDLIAELAKLMANSSASPSPDVQPVSRPSEPVATPAPAVRIPGMDAPRPAAQAPQAEPRAPSTGSIRIPGMDQPAPVSTSAPVGKLDFGGKPAVAPIKQEPLSTFTERLQGGKNLADESSRLEPSITPIRIPSEPKPASDMRPAAAAPTPVAVPGKPATPVAPAVSSAGPSVATPAPGEFHFDFGFAQNPPVSANPPKPIPQPQPAGPPVAKAAPDAIAALIEAELALPPKSEPAPQPAPEPRPAVVTPMIRAVGGQAAQAPQPAKPVISPVAATQIKPAPIPAAAAPVVPKPASPAPRPMEPERFAPGVGLNKPAAAAPVPQAKAPEPVSAPLDPMSEIESLIGEAVRVELSGGPVRVQAAQQIAPQVNLEPDMGLEAELHAAPHANVAAPVVPPLTTAFAPRRANLKEDPAASSAEDAILAAAAASGAEVGRLEPSVGDGSPYRRQKAKGQRQQQQPAPSGGLRQYVGMAVAGTLLLAAGLGLYWVLNMGRTATVTTAAATAPQLTADTTPVKVKPAQTPAPATDTAKSPVLAKMDGTSAAPSEEQLVSTDETNGGTVPRDVTPVTTGDAESGLANRKVRTVTVRPDGTIVSGDDALAGGAELPVDRPNVPSVPTAGSAPSLLDDVQVAAANPDPASTAPMPSAIDALPSVSSATDATSAVADLQPSFDPNVVAPTPMSFPVHSQALAFNSAPPTNNRVNAVVDPAAGQSIDLLGQSSDPMIAEAAPAVNTPAPVSAGSAAAYVQLSSQPSQALAEASAKSMASRYGSLFGGGQLTITPAAVSGKGTMYRVRLPASSLSEAANICGQIKAQGGDCFATNG